MCLNKLKCKLVGLGDWAFSIQEDRARENRDGGAYDNKMPTKVWPVSWLTPVPSLKLLHIDLKQHIWPTSSPVLTK